MSEIKAGATDQSIEFVLLDATTGEPATGLTIADLDASYARTRSAAVQNALTALSAVTDAHADNQAIQVHATFQPGVYRVDFPDAAFAAGAAFVTLVITGAAIKPSHRNFSLVVNTAEDIYTRLGAPAGASVSADVAAVKAETAAIVVDTNELQTDWANGGRLDLILDARASQASVDTVDGIVDAILVDTGTDIPATLATLATAADLAAVDTVVDAIQAKTDALPADPADQSLIIAATDAVMTRLGAPAGASVSADIASVKADSASIESRGARTVVRGTVSGTSPTTTSLTPSALSPAGAAADQFKGRIIIFDNDTATAELRGQATDITANTAAALPVFTFTALTTAPASGDTFSIV
jgi:hypothetical protein